VLSIIVCCLLTITLVFAEGYSCSWRVTINYRLIINVALALIFDYII